MQDEKTSMAEQMRQHIAACQVSGMYVDHYCKEQHLKPSTYYYWRKKLLEDLKQIQDPLYKYNRYKKAVA